MNGGLIAGASNGGLGPRKAKSNRTWSTNDERHGYSPFRRKGMPTRLGLGTAKLQALGKTGGSRLPYPARWPM
jgi:hypothetical protein